MDRLSMLKEATKLAHETVDGSAALNDAEYAELSKMTPYTAQLTLAKEILEEAASNIEP